MNIVSLPVETASAEALAPFGQLIAADPNRVGAPDGFYKSAVHISYPAAFACDEPVEIALATLDLRPFEVRYLERHFLHTQVFLPLGGRPFVTVMAPPGEADMPDLAAARAFRFAGTTGFVMHRGTWHEFPFALEPDTRIVVLLSSQTGYDLKSRDAVTQEAFGPDLDKKDIAERTGTVLRFEIAE